MFFLSDTQCPLSALVLKVISGFTTDEESKPAIGTGYQFQIVASCDEVKGKLYNHQPLAAEMN